MYSPIDMKRSTKYGNNYWVTYSPKVKRNVKFFSDLEYDNWVYIETNPNIVTFCEQPLRIQVEIGDDIVESIFDMWIKYKDNTEEFIEVKYNCELDQYNKKSKRSLKQVNAQKQWCKENNFKYSVKTETEIRKDLIYLNNLKHIINHVKNISYLDANDLETINNSLVIESKTIREIVHITKFNVNYVFQLISWLFYVGLCNIKIEEAEFNLDTEVFLIDKT